MFVKLFGSKKKSSAGLGEVRKRMEEIGARVGDLERRLAEIEGEKKFFLKKVGILRYDAVSKVGGIQSFSIALLDERETGFVITSLYFKEKNRVFIKPIEEGKTEHALSREEKRAIKKAKNSYD